MKFTQVTYTKACDVTCKLCGHEIHNLYHVEHEGYSLIIGSECAKQHLGPLAQTIARYERRAAKEWREEKPEGEERGDYVARRVNEQIQALHAWRSWKCVDSQYKWPNVWPNAEMREQKVQEIESRFIERAHWINKTAYSI
jgi:hypothetical protein